MTVSRIIRGVEGEAFDRWELPDVDAPRAAQPPKSGGVKVSELEALQKAAYDEGFAQGRKDGLAQGQKEGRVEGFAAGEQDAQALAQRMRRILDALAEPVRELDDAVEQALVRLSLGVARQIIRRELSLQPGEVLAVIKEAVALLPLSARDVSVRLHPDDARFIRETLDVGDDAAVWTMVEDPAISRGGCRVVTSTAQIDATLEHRLAQLASSLLGGVRDADGAEA
jgi:flagellar assembly protein FliH